MLIHDHGVWLPSNHRIAALARRLAIPLVLHPRGMLEPWAMAFRPQKKRLALALYQRRDLESVGMFVATAAPEAENLRALGLRQPIAVIPNGIPTEMLVTPVRSASTARHPRQALFLSRVHPKKGLLNLIEAWAAVKPDGWQLVIAGPDENQHLQQVMALASTRGVSHLVKYVGEVKGQRKQQVYADADLFVLPTFSENFGVVVAEAMAHSLPVITTHGTPWSELPRQKCGWWIEVGAEPLAHALRDATALPPAEREAMGQRARETVQRYNWEAIAAHMQQAYEWLVRGGQRPGCIWAD
jgi:glycosyltransferase involved in cell wall biosynthesis